MSNEKKIPTLYRGKRETMPQNGKTAEPRFTTDTHELFINDGDGKNVLVGSPNSVKFKFNYDTNIQYDKFDLVNYEGTLYLSIIEENRGNNPRATLSTAWIIFVDLNLTEFKTALGNATQSVAGLLSAEDKTHLDGLVALLESSDGNTVVDTIGEILAIFNNYPEGADLVTTLNGKVDKVAGKELSQNDFTDLLKAKLEGLLDGTQDITYDNTVSGLTATTVKGAIDEIDTRVKTNVDRIENGLQVQIDEMEFVVGITVEGNNIKVEHRDGDIIYIPVNETVESGHYDTDTKELVLELTNGNEIRISADDIVAGLVTVDYVDAALALKENKSNKLTELVGVPNNTQYMSAKLTNDLIMAARTEINSMLDDKVNKNENITAGTHAKITYDEKGLVTGGADLLETDIPELPQSKITNLGTALSGKANSVHTHAISDVLELQDSLDSKEVSANKVTSWGTTPTNTKYPSEKLVKDSLNNKVDKVTNKGLSTNDFTNTLKTKLDGIEAGAEVNVQSDWNITNTANDGFIKNKPITVVATPEMTEKVGLNANNELVVKPSSDGYEPDGVTIILNNSNELEVSKDLEVEWTKVVNKPTFSTVATTGSYNDLSGKPDLTEKLDKDFSALPNQASPLLTDVLVINRGTVAQKTTLGNLLAQVDAEIFVVVASLPTTGVVNKIYLLPKGTPESQDGYDEYIWVNNTWELIGSVKLDLSNYYNKTEANGLLSAKVDKNNAITAGTKTKITYDAKGLVTGGEALVAGDIPNLNASKINEGTFPADRLPVDIVYTDNLEPYAKKTELFSKDYNDLTNKPELQEKLVAGDNITIVGDTISASGGEVDPYFNYASDIYGSKYSLLANAWEHSLTVDPSEIERNSTFSIQYGTLQYLNGEDNGVIIPEGVTSIGSNAFRSWKSNNQPLVIPNSVTSIGSSAFFGWTSNNQPLVIPNSVTSIGGSAFRNWSANTHPIVIPNSVTNIGDVAFMNWTSNNQPLVIPNSVTSIGVSAFSYWTSNNQPLVIPNSVTSIGSSAFYSWSANNQPLVIPNSVTSIGVSTFSYWSANTHPLVIPEGVTSIDSDAFNVWTANNHPLVIPNSVTSIGGSAFRNWPNVPYIEMKSETPPALAHSNAFSNQNDAPIYVPDGSVDAYKTATNWSDLASRIFSISEKDKTIEDAPSDSKLYGRKDNSWEEIPSGSEVDLNEMSYFDYAGSIYGDKYSLLAAAWEDMKKVDETDIGTAQYPNGDSNGIIIPDGVTSIGEGVFGGGTNNKPLVIPNSVTSIGIGAFSGWNVNTQPLVIPNSVTSISDAAFDSWISNSHPIVIPNSVTNIGDVAFMAWNKVPYVEMKSETPPTLGGSNAFGNQNDAPIYVPDGSVEAYKTATNWSSLASRIFSINEKDKMPSLPKPIYQASVNWLEENGTSNLFDGINGILNPNGFGEFYWGDTIYRRVKEVTFVLLEQEVIDLENPPAQYSECKRMQSITIPLLIHYYNPDMPGEPPYEQMDTLLFYPITLKKLDGSDVTIKVKPHDDLPLDDVDDTNFTHLQVEVTGLDTWDEQTPVGSPQQSIQVIIKYESNF